MPKELELSERPDHCCIKELSQIYITFNILCGGVGQCQMCSLIPYFALTEKNIRLITFSERLDTDTEPLFLQLNILPIDKLIQDRIGLFMYKMYNGLHPPTINNMYIKNSNVHNHNTRHKNYLHVSLYGT